MDGLYIRENPMENPIKMDDLAVGNLHFDALSNLSVKNHEDIEVTGCDLSTRYMNQCIYIYILYIYIYIYDPFCQILS